MAELTFIDRYKGCEDPAIKAGLVQLTTLKALLLQLFKVEFH